MNYQLWSTYPLWKLLQIRLQANQPAPLQASRWPIGERRLSRDLCSWALTGPALVAVLSSGRALGLFAKKTDRAKVIDAVADVASERAAYKENIII